jgi:hypothetical protein
MYCSSGPATRTYSYAVLSFFLFLLAHNFAQHQTLHEYRVLHPLFLHIFGSIFHTHFCVFLNGGEREHLNATAHEVFSWQLIGMERDKAWWVTLGKARDPFYSAPLGTQPHATPFTSHVFPGPCLLFHSPAINTRIARLWAFLTCNLFIKIFYLFHMISVLNTDCIVVFYVMRQTKLNRICIYVEDILCL